MKITIKNRIQKKINANLFVFLLIAFVFTFTPDTAEAAPNFFTDFSGWVGNGLGTIILTIGASFAWLGGQLLDVTVAKLIIGFGSTIQGSVSDAIAISWGVIRDFSNLAFIFGFIWIGIKTIIDYQDANTKKMLASLIIAALLINFSLFFTQVIVDVSNVFAVNIYNTLSVSAFGANKGIAANYMDAMGIATVYNSSNGFSINEGNFAFYTMSTIFLMIAGFTFASGAILLISRFVALIFIMIFSPVLFAATVFPQTKNFASSLWRKLFSYAFFAPLYLLLILVSFKIVESIASSGQLGGGTFSDALSSSKTTNFSIILTFVIIIMFLILSLKVAESLSVKGGSQTLKIGRSMRGYGQRVAGGATAGMAARLGRSTVGRGAAALSSNKKFQKFAANNRLGGGVMKATQGVADSNFDVRSVGGVGKSLDIGTGKKGGYNTRLKEKTVASVKFAETLGADKNEVARAKRSATSAKNNLEGENKKLSDATANDRENLVKEQRVFDSKLTSDADKASTRKNITKIEKDIERTEGQFASSLNNLTNALDNAESHVSNLENEGRENKLAYGNRLEHQSWTRKQILGTSDNRKAKAANSAIIAAVNKSPQDKQNEKLLDGIKKLAQANKDT